MSSPRNKQSKGELLAPAGRFSAGVYALRSGADALYLGLSAFSARKAARNFSLDELSRIKALAEKDGKRVYAALNTVIRDDEMRRAASLLYELEALEIDGVIVQDLGLSALLRKHFPRLPVHASTQMGVHNSAGVEFIKSLGIRRIILSRELSFDEIARIRADHPDVELEVFIHGALCYSFSGLCLASGLLLGRSGNRGECAQICRTWFDAEPDGGAPPSGFGSGAGDDEPGSSPRRGYFFSCNDLAAGEDVLRLREIGVDAFKIEGRMKPPAWVAAVTAYYRLILDGRPANEAAEAALKARTIFSRRPTLGHLPGGGGTDLVNPDYPGHAGLPAGVAKAGARGGKPGFGIRLRTPLAVRDGLLYFRTPGDGGPGNDAFPPVPILFGVEGMEAGGRRVTAAAAGEDATVFGAELPPPGTEVFKISSHDAKLPDISSNLPPKRIPVDLTLRPEPGALTVIAQSPYRLFPPVEQSFSVVLQSARAPKPFADVAAEHLSAPGGSRFVVRRVEIENESGLAADGIFINPADLKRIRREVFARVEEGLRAGGELRLEQAFAGEDGGHAAPAAGKAPSFRPPARNLIGDAGSGLPFVADPAALRVENLYTADDGRVYLPLAPVIFDADDYLGAAAEFIRREIREKPGIRFVAGLGNPAHFQLARIFEDNPALEFYIDYGLLAANRRTLRFLREEAPRLLFHYPWIEDPSALPRDAEAGLPAVEYGAFNPPLFISRVCVWRHGFRKSGACLACGRNLSAGLRQGKSDFQLRSVRIAGACLNLLFRRR